MAFALFLSAPAHADALIDNANGYTIDAEGNLTRFTGLLFNVETGRVTGLLRRGDDRPRELDFRYDAHGQTVIPGFIDSHGHLMDLGEGAIQLDLSDTDSLEEAMARLAAYAEANPTLFWIVGRGWNHERWGLGRYPTAADIDAVVPDRPVWLVRADNHAGVANSMAMEAAGITPATQAPAGGRIERTGRNPSGTFVDAATALITDHIPPLQPPVRDMALREAQDILLGYGITTMADMGTTAADWDVLRRAGDRGLLRLRFISYAHSLETLLNVAGDGPTPWLYDGHLRMMGLKIFVDGAMGSRGALLFAPYSDAPDQSGFQLIDGIDLRNRLSRLAIDHFQPAVHAIGDRANREVLDAIDEIASRYNDDRRWRIEHVQDLEPSDIPRFGQHGIIASMQPVHQTSDRLMIEARIGLDRISGTYAWNSLLRAGGRLAFGTDFPVESPDPFPGLAAAVTRQDANGEPAGGWTPHERISMLQAFRAYTTGGAYAAFAEDQIGRLGEGLYADFAILDRDIFAIPPEELRATRVLETWVGGHRSYVRGAADAPPMDAPVGPMITSDDEVSGR